MNMGTIDWEDKGKDIIHGLLDGVVIIRMKRENTPPFLWEMSGMFSGKSQYRNDLKEMADVKFNQLKND